jgi:DNA mismatch repair protein MutL
MSKIRVLSDHVANQIAAGEVVERPASVAKELVENAIDAGARRVEVEVGAGGRALLRVADDGEGMTRDDAVLAFERHATSKISTAADLENISTLGFRGEALASIASVARVELVTQAEGEPEGTRVLVEGGRMRDVSPAARPRGTTITVRDLFFNVPARRKFLRSEATESFHLTNLVTHYALAHPEIDFTLTNNGREVLRAGAAADLRERAYQLFGASFLENLLEVGGRDSAVARVRGFVSAPHERRTTRDAQFLFVNGRYVRDRVLTRALSEGYRSVLPHGAYPAALLFVETPPAEVDVNVHPAKTEVRFRRAAAVGDAVREAVRAALGAGGLLRPEPRPGAAPDAAEWAAGGFAGESASEAAGGWEPESGAAAEAPGDAREPREAGAEVGRAPLDDEDDGARQEAMDFGRTTVGADESPWRVEVREGNPAGGESPAPLPSPGAPARARAPRGEESARSSGGGGVDEAGGESAPALPPLGSLAGFVREVARDALSHDIRPLGQLEESYIVATDPDGLLLIDQHVAHERVLFDQYRRAEAARPAESQNLLVPETLDLTPAQAAAFEEVAEELERYGFSLMRLSGRTVAVRAVPADLPAGGVRSLLAELLDGVEAERRGRTRAAHGETVAAALACRAAVKSRTPLTPEKMRWLIARLLQTSSPTTCPHGRPVILRLSARDIERGFRRP